MPPRRAHVCCGPLLRRQAVLAEASARERTVPERFREPLADVEAVADAACHAFGELHPHTAHDADDGAKMKVGVLWLEPALKRFIYRDLQESSACKPEFPLWTYAESFPWQWAPGFDELDFEDTAMDCFGDAVRLEHTLALWVELRKRRG